MDTDMVADPSQILTYSLSGTDMASFTISQTNDDDTTDVDEEGLISVKAGTKLDHEAKSTYRVTVTATDSDGLSASIDVTITVTNVDEAPEIMVGGLAISGTTRVDYAEDRRDAVATYTAFGPDADMATWSLEGDDAGQFSITNGGMLTFVSSPDYENPASANMDNTYMVTVMADDGTYMAMRDVVVTVTDVEDTTTPVTDGTLLERLLERFDTEDDNGVKNGQIDKSEVVDAIIAFVTPGASNKPSKEDIVDLIVHFVTTPR